MNTRMILTLWFLAALAMAGCGDGATPGDDTTVARDAATDINVDVTDVEAPGDAADIAGEVAADALENDGTDTKVDDADQDADDAAGQDDAEDATDLGPAGTVVVETDRDYVNVGGGTVKATATTDGTTGDIVWSLSPNVGSLSSTKGETVTYTPPSTLDTMVAVTIKATVGRASGSAAINVDISLRDGALPLLARRFVPLTKVAELVMLGRDLTGNGVNQVVLNPWELYGKVNDGPIEVPEGAGDDPTTYLDERSDAFFGRGMKKSAEAGNFDNDPRDEIAVATWKEDGTAPCVLKVIDTDENGVVTNINTGLDTTVDITAEKSHSYEVKVADVDGDGYDEFVVMGVAATAAGAWLPAALWIVDDASSGYNLIRRIDLPAVGNGKLAVGSMRADHSVQIVFAWSVSGAPGLKVIDAATGSAIGNEFGAIGLEDGIGNFDLALADLDGDGADELVVGRSTYSGDGTAAIYRTKVYDDLDHALAVLQTGSIATWPDYATTLNGWAAYGTMFLHHWMLAYDYNDDGTDEMLYGDQIFKFNDDTSSFESVVILGHENLVSDVRLADINGDHRKDVIYATGYESSPAMVTWMLLARADGSGVADWTRHDFGPTGGTYQEVTNSIVVPADVDGDSLYVEYCDDTPVDQIRDNEPSHTIVYRDNKLIALLAAPPVQDGITQAVDYSSTSFGDTSTSSVTSGLSTSGRAGVTVGYEESISTGLAVAVEVFSLELEVTAEVEYTGTSTWSTSKSVGVSYSGNATDDQVIYATTPYDRYRYRVVQSPDASVTDGYIYVDMPRDRVMMSVTRDYYNSRNADGLQITKDLLPNTPMDLDSYVDSATVLARTSVDVGNGRTLDTDIELLDMSDPVAVSQSGTVEREVDFNDASSVGNDVTFSLDASASATVSGVTAGASTGFSIGGFWEYSTENTTSFIATVGGISDWEMFEANQYSWGMYVYRQALKDEKGARLQDFFVINYYIQK